MACETFWVVYAVSRSLVQGLIFFNIAKTGALPVGFGNECVYGFAVFSAPAASWGLLGFRLHVNMFFNLSI